MSGEESGHKGPLDHRRGAVIDVGMGRTLINELGGTGDRMKLLVERERQDRDNCEGA